MYLAQQGRGWYFFLLEKVKHMMRMHLRSFVAVIALIIAVGQSARAVDIMYVTNGGQTGSFVSKYDQAGTYYGQITTNLNSPAGIAQDSGGNIYIVNNGIIRLASLTRT